jgi:hypothetical protein
MEGDFFVARWFYEYCRAEDDIKILFPILFFISSFSFHTFNVRTLTVESSRPERATPSLAAECEENHQEFQSRQPDLYESQLANNYPS